MGDEWIISDDSPKPTIRIGGDTPLMVAIRDGREVSAIAILLGTDHKVDHVNEKTQDTALSLAYSKGMYMVVNRILELVDWSKITERYASHKKLIS